MLQVGTMVFESSVCGSRTEPWVVLAGGGGFPRGPSTVTSENQLGDSTRLLCKILQPPYALDRDLPPHNRAVNL
jgi:hypothetical protein